MTGGAVCIIDLPMSLDAATIRPAMIDEQFVAQGTVPVDRPRTSTHCTATAVD
jgi:hypothetical protein